MEVNLVTREASRLEEQVRLDLLKSAAERNEWGQFATPPALAEEMARYVEKLWAHRTDKVRFLDPAIGTGSFFSALVRVGGRAWIESAEGIELDKHFARVARELWANDGLRVVDGDFTHARPPATEKANLILTNPPYVRHHHLEQDEKLRLKALATHIAETEVSGLSGLYCYFMLLAHEWLSEGGLSVWLVPSEFMDVNYGRALQRYLTHRVTLVHIHRFDPHEVQFGDALVSSAIVVYRRSKPTDRHAVKFSFGGSLLHPKHEEKVALSRLRDERKWSGFGHPNQSPLEREAVCTLASLFTVKRGIATGADDFFVMERGAAVRLGIPEKFLKPVLPPPRQVSQTIIEGDEQGYPMLDPQLAVVDTDLSETDLKRTCPALWKYLKAGEAQGVDKLYLAGKRSPWYRQEQRPPAPFLSTYMGRVRENGKPFRFFWNRSQAIATNVYLLLYPIGPLKLALEQNPKLLQTTFELLQEISARTLVSEGRVYGGGLHKLEPCELSRIDATASCQPLRLP